jgi:hypothetical protein
MEKPSLNTITGDIVSTTRTYDELFCLTGIYLKYAQEEEKYRLYNCMIVMVFSAFALEAYINHLGEKYIHDWERYEKKKFKDKLKHVFLTTSYTTKLESKPFCYIDEIFDYRKQIVHGRTEKIINRQKLIIGDIPKLPETEWQKHTNLMNAEKFRNRVEEIIEKLSLEVESQDFPLGSPYDAYWQG